MATSHEFYTDKDVARLLKMSSSWVRVQRHKRRRNQPHVLDLEPRMIGSCPRYVRAEVEELIELLIDSSTDASVTS